MEGPITFNELMEVQFELQKQMAFPGMQSGSGPCIAGTKEMLYAAIHECTEAMNELPWKCWKPEDYKKVDKHKFTTELTDIIQFVANAAIYMNISAEEMTEALRAKWVINDQRIADGETTT